MTKWLTGIPIFVDASKMKRMKAVLLSMVCTAVICSPAGYVSAQTHTIRLENSVGQLPDSNHQNPNGQLPDSNNQNPNKQLPDGNHPDSNGQMPDRDDQDPNGQIPDRDSQNPDTQLPDGEDFGEMQPGDAEEERDEEKRQKL